MSGLYQHNQELYDGIIKAIGNGSKKLGYTEATGLGKSFVFIELCKTVFKGKKILYVVPKVCISESILFYKEYEDVADCIDFTTYAMFNSEDKALEFAEKYDVLVADECHHLLSDIQGCNVDICGSLISEKVGGYYIGMTATIEVGGVNVLEKYFDAQVYGYDLYSAIIDNIYPKMDYVVALPDLSDIPKDLAVKYNIDCSKPMLESVLSERKVHKVLMYFSNIKELKANIPYVGQILGGYRLFYMFSSIDENTSGSKILEEYNNCKEDCVLMSVSMLLEGVHVRGVDCAIIYRNIGKLHTFLQIIGRLFSYGMGTSPLIVDVTNSLSLFNKLDRVNYGLEKDCVRKERILKDIINPLCSGYKYIDFLKELGLSDKLVLEENYRGIEKGVYTPSSLARKLNVKKDKIYGYKRRFGSSCTPEGIIDYIIDKNWLFLSENYRGIGPCSSVREICEQSGANYNTIRPMISRLGLTSGEEVVDYILDKYKKRVSKFILTKDYRGIKACNSVKGLSTQIGINAEAISNIIDSEGISSEKLVDRLLDEYKRVSHKIYVLSKEYRGVQPCVGLRNIAKQLGIEESRAYNYSKGNSWSSAEEAIDYLIDKRSKHDVLLEEYRGIKPCRYRKELADQLGVGLQTVVYHLKKGRSSKEIIDGVLDGNFSTKVKYFLDEEYRGIKPFKTLDKLIEQLGVSKNTLLRYAKLNNFSSVKELIDYVLDKK